MLIGLLGAVAPLGAQEWNDQAALRLAEHAIGSRMALVADSSLLAYSARAHGVVTFLAALGPEGLASRLIRADELAVEVYWERPDRSKQLIRSWRDTTLAPTPLDYHRDHLAIIPDEFGAAIWIGHGDEVAGVVHPLSPAGFDLYEYRLRDSIRITLPAEQITVMTLEVRPKVPSAPGVVGTFYIDCARGAAVRTELSFTPAAYRDRAIEDITVRFERTLVDGRYWLPLRQDIEIRRGSAVMDFPFRGIIRGQWDIDAHQLNQVAIPVEGAPGSVGGLARPGGPALPGTLLVALDSALVRRSESGLEGLRAQAARLVRARGLIGLPRGRLAASRVSDVIRVNRVEGLRLGAGVSARVGPIDRLGVAAGYGMADRRLTWRVDAAREAGGVRWSAFAQHTIADIGDVPAVSGVINSIAAQEGGRDLGDYVLLDRVGLGARVALGRATMVGFELARERARSVATRAEPARNSYRPNPALGGGADWVGRMELEHWSDRPSGRRGRVTLRAEAGAGGVTYGRMVGMATVARPLAGGELGGRLVAGVGTAELPNHRAFVFGGSGSLPGEPFRAFGGRRASWGAAEWLYPLPGPSVRLGAFGRTGSRLWVGPVVGAGVAGGELAGMPWRPSAGVRPTVGVAVEAFDRLLRVEVGQGLRGKGGLSLSLDVARAWWPIL